MARSRQNGESLEVWNLEQLQKLVADFKAQLKDNPDASPTPAPAPKPKAKFELKEFGLLQQQFSKEVNCEKAVLYETPKEGVQVFVSEPQRQGDGGLIFGLAETTYLLFKVQTPAYKWVVRRRYTDFQWLRNTVARLFPHLITPPIPRKKKNKKSEQDLARRMNVLQLFLGSLASHPQVFCSSFVVGFLSLVDRDRFQEVINNTDKRSAPVLLAQHATLSGKTRLRADGNVRVATTSLPAYIDKAEVKYKQLTRSSKSLQSSFRLIQEQLFSMSKQFAQLFDNFSLFDQRLGAEQTRALSGPLISLNNLAVEWAESISETIGSIEKNFTSFFKFMRHQLYSVRQLHATARQHEVDYASRRRDLNLKKAKLFDSKDSSKWDGPPGVFKAMRPEDLSDRSKVLPLMCHKEEQELTRLFQNYSFFGGALLEGLLHNFRSQAERIAFNFNEFTIKEKCLHQRLAQMFSAMSNQFDRAFSGCTTIRQREAKPAVQDYDD